MSYGIRGALGDVVYKVVECGKLSPSLSCGFLGARSFCFPPLYNLTSTSIRAGRDLETMAKYNATLDQTCLLAGAAVEVRSQSVPFRAS